MSAYQTIDFLPDLTQHEMLNAGKLTFIPHKIEETGIDNKAEVSGDDPNALLHSLYRFDAKEGATYNLFSFSFFDPYLLRIYDADGNVIVANEEHDDPYMPIEDNLSADFIKNWVAPYTGTYYVNASWNQGNFYKYYSLIIVEDVDTASKPVPPAQPIINNIDRIFNWGESVYPDLFPEHQESKGDVFGYYARMYSNGDALGEQNGNIYYYDGGVGGSGQITLVGTVSDYLPLVIEAGF